MSEKIGYLEDGRVVRIVATLDLPEPGQGFLVNRSLETIVFDEERIGELSFWSSKVDYAERVFDDPPVDQFAESLTSDGARAAYLKRSIRVMEKREEELRASLVKLRAATRAVAHRSGENYLSFDEVCNRLDVSRSLLDDIVANPKNGIKIYRISDRNPRIAEADLDAFVRSKLVGTNACPETPEAAANESGFSVARIPRIGGSRSRINLEKRAGVVQKSERQAE